LLVEWIEPEQVLSVIDRIGKTLFPFKQAKKRVRTCCAR
jgi:hypothetical protein